MRAIRLMSATVYPRRLNRWAAQIRVREHDRRLHSLVYETFGKERAPKPFHLQQSAGDESEEATLLAYTTLDQEELREAARNEQSTVLATVMPPELITTTPTPERWTEGQRLRFMVRVRPTRRSGETGRQIERDVYRNEDGITRAEAYCAWIAGLMKQQGGAEAAPESMTMSSFTLQQTRRKARGPRFSGPDATIKGVLEIRDADLFAELLSRGLGRHRAYGYGMLLVAPG